MNKRRTGKFLRKNAEAGGRTVGAVERFLARVMADVSVCIVNMEKKVPEISARAL